MAQERMTVTAHPHNVGKRVRFTVKRGDISVSREATIVSFRGGYKSKTNKPHAAWGQYQMGTKQWDTTWVPLNNMEYVSW